MVSLTVHLLSSSSLLKRVLGILEISWMEHYSLMNEWEIIRVHECFIHDLKIHSSYFSFDGRVYSFLLAHYWFIWNTLLVVFIFLCSPNLWVYFFFWIALIGLLSSSVGIIIFCQLLEVSWHRVVSCAILSHLHPRFCIWWLPFFYYSSSHNEQYSLFV